MTAEKTIFLKKDNAQVKKAGRGDSRPGEKDIYAQGISKRIKMNIKQAWERQKHLHGRTQEELAAHLNVSQGAVSKLLSDMVGHPWSTDKIELFASFCEVPVVELIGDADLVGRHGETVPLPAQRTDEAKAELKRFIGEYGTTLDDAKLLRLAGRLASRVENTDRSPQAYNAEIMKLLILEAGGPWGSLL